MSLKLQQLKMIQDLMAMRVARGRHVITPSMIVKFLGITFLDAVVLMEQYRVIEPGHLRVLYRALCDHCNGPNDVTNKYEAIKLGKCFSIHCASCENQFEANDSNIIIEYKIEPEFKRDHATTNGGPQGDNLSSPCRIERMTHLVLI